MGDPELLPVAGVEGKELAIASAAEGKVTCGCQDTRPGHGVKTILPGEFACLGNQCPYRSPTRFVGRSLDQTTPKRAARTVVSLTLIVQVRQLPDREIEESRFRTVGGREPIGGTLHARTER